MGCVKSGQSPVRGYPFLFPVPPIPPSRLSRLSRSPRQSRVAPFSLYPLPPYPSILPTPNLRLQPPPFCSPHSPLATHSTFLIPHSAFQLTTQNSELLPGLPPTHNLLLTTRDLSLNLNLNLNRQAPKSGPAHDSLDHGAESAQASPLWPSRRSHRQCDIRPV